MMRHTQATQVPGFSLMELMIAMATGLVALGAAVELYIGVVNGASLVSQRAEMQQNSRAAMGLVVQDISLAGADLPTGGVPLPTGNPTRPKYGCDQVQCYVGGGTTPSGIAFPNVGSGNQLYGVIPGYKMGMAATSGGTPTDVITVVYSDITLPLKLFTVSAFASSGGSITFTPPANPPSPAPPYPALNDPAVGIQVGDVIMVQNGNGAAIGEVTGLTGNTLSFADLDPLNINQSSAPGGNLKAIANTCTGSPAVCTPLTPAQLQQTFATRLFVITYYIDVPPGPDGVRYTADDLPPRLMRQINGQSPVPVAENVIDLGFSYDTYDDATGAQMADNSDAGLAANNSPNNIRKVNIKRLVTRGSVSGRAGLWERDPDERY